jgi:hypothetical protein
MRPVDLSIDGKVWTYGGTAPDDHGVWYRTLNDDEPSCPRLPTASAVSVRGCPRRTR